MTAKALLGMMVAVAAAFVLTIAAVKSTLLSGGIMVIWPVEGVVLALMLGPLRQHPYMTMLLCKVSSIIAAVSVGSTVQLASSMSAVTAASSIGIFWLMRINRVEHRPFTDSKLLVLFLSAAIAASIVAGLSESLLFHVLRGTTPTQLLLTGSASNAVGYAVMTPLVLIISHGFREPMQSRIGSKCIFVLLLYCVLVSSTFMQDRYAILYPIPLGLMLVAYTADLATVAVMVMFTTSVAFVATLLGHGPIDLTPGRLPERILVLQAFLIIITATTLPVAAVMAEHDRLKRSLITAKTEAELANQAKSVFLATISHEIRTPLNGVLGMAQAMSMDDLNVAQQGRVDVIRRSGETLLGLLNDVLDLSKIEAGKMEVESIAFDLGDLLSNLVANYESAAHQRGLSLTLDLAATAGVYRGDPTRVRQILNNLVSNALKFTENGGVKVVCAMLTSGVELSVSDTGIGIPQHKMGALFTKFSQVDASTTRRFGGTGLGLSICHELADLMGGEISVRSTEGEGACFTLRLPLERLGHSAPSLEQPVDVQDMGNALTLRILAAEDNPTNQLVLRTLLEFGGVEVTIVENGQAAVEAWEQQSWDLILMDVHMPVMDGATATRAIRARELALGRPRTLIVALTANTMSHQVQDYLAAGMDEHLAKPIEAPALFQLLASTAEGLSAAPDDLPSLRSHSTWS